MILYSLFGSSFLKRSFSSFVKFNFGTNSCSFSSSFGSLISSWTLCISCTLGGEGGTLVSNGSTNLGELTLDFLFSFFSGFGFEFKIWDFTVTTELNGWKEGNSSLLLRFICWEWNSGLGTFDKAILFVGFIWLFILLGKFILLIFPVVFSMFKLLKLVLKSLLNGFKLLSKFTEGCAISEVIMSLLLFVIS